MRCVFAGVASGSNSFCILILLNISVC